jgi:ribosomal-protein-alanine N-acetyltransferase
MTEALTSVTDFASAVHGLHRVFALPYEWNPASIRILEKAGYEREGRLCSSAFKDGKLIDQFLYAWTKKPQ